MLNQIKPTDPCVFLAPTLIIWRSLGKCIDLITLSFSTCNQTHAGRFETETVSCVIVFKTKSLQISNENHFLRSQPSYTFHIYHFCGQDGKFMRSIQESSTHQSSVAHMGRVYYYV